MDSLFANLKLHIALIKALYAAWFDTIVLANAREAVIRSVDRYIHALEGIFSEEESNNK